MYELNSFRVTLKQEALFNISNNQILYYRLFLKTSKQNKIKWILIESSLNRVPYVLCVPAWSTCPRGNVPINVPTCKRHPIIQLGVPKACQLFNLASQIAKAVSIFQLGVSTCQKGCEFFNFACQNAYIFFIYFSKEFFNYA